MEKEGIFEECYNMFEPVYSEVEIDGVVYAQVIHILDPQITQ